MREDEKEISNPNENDTRSFIKEKASLKSELDPNLIFF